MAPSARRGRIRLLGFGLLAVVLLSVAGFAGWLFTLPASGVAPAPSPVEAGEIEATLAALKPPKRARPLVAIIGINDATETTDYLVPYGILRRADVADVVSLATASGPVKLYPALKVAPDATVAEFDARHPEGADYVIVPAMSRDDDPAVLDWLREQAGKGAIVIGVCAGAKVVGAAGLLDGKRATTHWYYLDALREARPSMRYVPDRRFVVDGAVATTTGITASMPMMLTLIQAIAGEGRAWAVAQELGLPHWDARHDSDAFRFTRPFATTVLGNRTRFWAHEAFTLALQPGFDEVSLALVADAWSRTYRSRVETYAPSPGEHVTRNGIRVLPDHIGEPPRGLPPVSIPGDSPASTLDETLREIAERYGAPTASAVAMQLEYQSAPGRTVHAREAG